MGIQAFEARGIELGLLERITARSGEDLGEPGSPSPTKEPTTVGCRVLPDEFWWEVSGAEDSGDAAAVLMRGTLDEAGELVGRHVKTVKLGKDGLRAAGSGRGEALLLGVPYTPMLTAEMDAVGELGAPCRDMPAWRVCGEAACEQAMRSALADAAEAITEAADAPPGDLGSVARAAERARAATGRAVAALRIAETGLIDVAAMACEEAAEIGRVADIRDLVEDAATGASAEVTAREAPALVRALEQAVRAKEAELARDPLEERVAEMPRREKAYPDAGRLAWSRWPVPGDDGRANEGAK